MEDDILLMVNNKVNIETNIGYILSPVDEGAPDSFEKIEQNKGC